MAERCYASLLDPTTDASLAGPEVQVHVAGGYFAYTPPPDAPDVSALPAETSGVVTFGSTNDLLKVNDQVLVTWAEILTRLPTSRLFVKARALSSPDLRERVLRVLNAAGIDERRVRLAGETSRREHQLAYSDIDVLLDTFPYSGATTTAEALWMGVPVLTLAGDRHAARLTTSILRTVGLDDFVTETRDDYVRSAVRIAGDIEGLARLRRSLRELVARSPLVDGTRVARAIERASIERFRHWARSTA